MQSHHYWIETALRIAKPVFATLADDRLRETMPVESLPAAVGRADCTHLEAVGRSLAGIAPWLNLRGGDPAEQAMRLDLTQLVIASLQTATNPRARDFLNFGKNRQALVDAAFLAQGLLRAWDGVWLRLDELTQTRLIESMRQTRHLMPPFNNWLLFSAMVEAFLCKAGAAWDRMRVDYALRQHEQWYRGDGAYGDGPKFHWDYYNSFVIQPMLFDLMHCDCQVAEGWAELKGPITNRLQRYAVVQERFISPEGTFPAIGRSLAYRMGAFHALALAAWKHLLPEGLAPESVRCALTAVIRRMVEAPGTFDENGWLRIGFCGHQPSIAEHYISTGSLYLCLCGMLPLGLPPEDPFWSAPDAQWSAQKLWSGEDMPADHAVD